MAYVITIGGTTINQTDTKPYVLAKTLKINPRADHRNNCAFKIATTAATFLPKVGQSVTITESGVTVFGGVIKVLPMERPGAGTGNTTTIYIDVMSDGYSDIPQRRTITAEYYGKTAGYIVGQYVTNFLAAEGISAGTISTGITLDAYRRSAMSIKESLDELADICGFKWYVDDAKALQFRQEDTVTAAAHDIVEGGAFTDFADVNVEENLSLYRNKQTVIGGVLDDGSTLTYSKQDNTEITARIAIEGGSGVYGNVFTDSSILTEADAEIAADNLLKKYGKVPIHLSFRSDTNDWVAGTKLKVAIPTFGIELGAEHIATPVGYTEVATALDLYNVRNNLTANYIQTADIDLSGYANWEPIGDYATNPALQFSGIYNGNNYEITGLTINRPTVFRQGLFGRTIIGSELRNIKIAGTVTCNGLGGGLVGDISASVINRCYSAVDVTTGGQWAGGLAGNSQDTAYISECYATGTINGQRYTGGLLGVNYNSHVNNCYATGGVTGTTEVGGLVGQHHAVSGTVTNCYAIGAVSGTSDVGGLIGKYINSGATVVSSYYDTTTTGQSDTGKGAPKTTAQMKQQATFTGWDFSTVWGISASVNSGYPNLQWYRTGETSYFLIEDVTIRDIGAGNLRSFISATRRSTLDADFSTQRSNDNLVDYMGALVRAAKGGSSGGSGGGGSAEAMTINLTASNASLVTLTTSAQTVLTKTLAIPQARTLNVGVLVPMSCEESMLITMTCEVDGVTVRTLTDYFFVDANANSKKHIFKIPFALPSVAAGAAKVITIKMQTSSSTAEIAAEAAQLTISSRGIDGS